MSGTRAISTTSRRELSSSFFFLQGKAPKEIHAILTETLACFLPGQAKGLSAPLYYKILLQCTVEKTSNFELSYGRKLDGASVIRLYFCLHLSNYLQGSR